MLISILLNAGLWLGAALLISDLFHDSVTRLLATVVVGFSVIVTVTELLSLFSLFRLAPVALVCGVLPGLGFCGYLILRKARRIDDSGSPTMEVPAVPQNRLASRTLCWLVLIAAGLMAWDCLLYGLMNPVQVDSDSPIYHLPFAIHWYKVGHLDLFPTPFGEEGAPYFPANGDLWLSWLALTSRGAAIIKVGQWVFLVVGGLALFAVARQTNASRESAAIVGGLWCCLPLTLRQASVANVDLIWAAFYFIAVHFLLRFCDSRQSDQASLRNLAMAALAMGIVLGTKSLGLVFIPPLLLTFAWKIWKHRPTSDFSTTRSFRCRALSVLVSCLILPSAYWFARTAWLTGNPLYPLDVSPGGLRIFVGMYDSTAMRRTAYHIPVAEWSLLLTRLRYVLGPLLISLWAVSLLAGLVTSRGNDGKSPSGAIRLLSLLALAHVGIYWFVLPYNTQERFLMAAIGIGLVPLARTLTHWPALSWPLALLVLGHVALALGAGPTVMDTASFRVLRGESPSELRWRVAGACVLLSLLTIVVRSHGPAPRSRQSILIPVAALVVACACLYAGPIERLAHRESRDDFYPETGFGTRMLPAWHIVEQATTSKAARIAYSGGNLPYYLLGSRLRNDVCYINVNAHRHWMPHDYHLARHNSGVIEKAAIPWPQWDREQTDYKAWLDNLRAAEVDLLFVSRVNLHGRNVDLHGQLPPFPIERKWADTHSEAFEDLGPRAAADPIPWARVYRVRNLSSNGGAGPQ